ncbi:MAG TPA: NAD(P)/FAD-dependent oxidoreductase [Terriglobia bacterium]|nr:NAD(P)/FAD-dependent oxidoreductase [Terriglobia bacterium]
MEKLRPCASMLDLAIIGGGPAGTLAALEARHHGLRVALWDRDRFPRDKVCGEFISSEARPILESKIPGTVPEGAEIYDAQFITNRGVSRTFGLPHPALGLSRRRLDHELWKTAEAAGVEAHGSEAVRRVRAPEPGGNRADAWEIETADGSVRAAKSLIIACGRWWAVEGLSSPASRPGLTARGDWIGAKAHFAGIPRRNRVEMYLFRGGYCGLAPVENGACNVCCLVHRQQVRQTTLKVQEGFAAWLAQVSRLPVLATRLRDAVQVSPVVTTSPVHLARRQAVQSGALMVGDASGFLDPFTGEGISMALHSGRLAGQAVAGAIIQGLDGQMAAENYRRNLSKAVRRGYWVAATARRLIQCPEWIRGPVTAPLPWLGGRLVRETRWRGNADEEIS